MFKYKSFEAKLFLSNHFNHKIGFSWNFAHNNFWSIRDSLDCKFWLISMKLSVRGHQNKSSVCNSSKHWCKLLLGTKFFPKNATNFLNNLKWKLEKLQNFCFIQKMLSINFDELYLDFKCYQTPFTSISEVFSWFQIVSQKNFIWSI